MIQRQTGGKRARMITSAAAVTDASMFSFTVSEDATFTLLTSAAGDKSIIDQDYSVVLPAGTTWFTPNLAQNITLSAGSIIAYEE